MTTLASGFAHRTLFEMRKRFEDAINTRDLRGIQYYYTPDAVLILPNRVILIGRDPIAEHVRDVLLPDHFFEIEFHIETLQGRSHLETFVLATRKMCEKGHRGIVSQTLMDLTLVASGDGHPTIFREVHIA